MDDCCRTESFASFALRGEQRRVLAIVLAINALLFFVELAAGLLAHSTALLGDSLDMLGDSLVYGFSLYVLGRSERVRTYAVVLKGVIMAVFGLFVVAEATSKMLLPVIPVAQAMGVIGLAALAGNALCFALLRRHRSDDLNMRSTWLCSRNDLLANTTVLAAAATVAVTGSIWPDVVVGVGIAALFLRTAAGVLRDSAVELRRLSPLDHSFTGEGSRCARRDWLV
jgi:cation diffusion facilitator family transporter